MACATGYCFEMVFLDAGCGGGYTTRTMLIHKQKVYLYFCSIFTHTQAHAPILLIPVKKKYKWIKKIEFNEWKG